MNGLDALLNNFAGATDITSFGFIASSQRRFLIEELTSVSAAIIIPITDIGSFSLIASNFGFVDYNEQSFGLAYGKKIFSNISISGQLVVLNTRINDYGNKAVATFDIGLYGNINDNLYYGLNIFSPEQVSITESTNVLSQLRMGLRYQPNPDLNIYFEAEKTIDEDLVIAGGFSYKIIDTMSLRVGGNTNPGLFTMGISYKLNNRVITDGAYSYHTTLGITPAISVKYLKDWINISRT